MPDWQPKVANWLAGPELQCVDYPCSLIAAFIRVSSVVCSRAMPPFLRLGLTIYGAQACSSYAHTSHKESIQMMATHGMLSGSA